MKKINYSIDQELKALLSDLNGGYFSGEILTLDPIFDYTINNYSITIQNLFKTGIFEKEIPLNKYLLLNNLHEVVYKAFCKDDKQLNEFEKKETFQNFFLNNLKEDEDFYSENNWETDTEYFASRKNSEKIIFKEGKVFVMDEMQKNDTFNSFLSNSKVFFPKYNLKLEGKSENHFWIYGSNPNRDDISIRVYFNLRPKKEKILELIKIIKTNFDDCLIPFAFKFLSDPEIYNKRNDCCVLYFSKKHSLVGFNILQKVNKRFITQDFFCESKPLFTLKIAKGISFGEEPNNAIFTSFGSYRAAAIALSFYRLKTNENDITLAKFKTKLNEFNLEEQTVVSSNPLFPGWNWQIDNKIFLNNFLLKVNEAKHNWTDHFYLNPKSKYDYEVELKYFKSNYFRKTIDKKNSLFKLCAKKIGSSLVSEADWYPISISELACNWVSFSNFTSNKDKVSSFNFKLLDNSFVEGRLGISFFMKMLSNIFPENREFHTTFYRSSKDVINFSNPSECEKWFLSETKYCRKKHHYGLEKTFEIIVQRPSIMKKDKLLLFLDTIITHKFEVTNFKSEITEFEFYLNEYLLQNKPFEFLTKTKEFCPSFNLGLAYIGYACLRIHNQDLFPALPLEISYI